VNVRGLLASLGAAAFLASAPHHLGAQGADAAALDERLRALGMTARVLMIAAHPDDEDTQLLTWLARARGAETAYLSLTRGDGGQNLIGNALGETLGAIRTEELLAARRIDGARQYFTRAYDFGFSKTAAETYAHWPKDSVLGDVMRVVRAFRPHIIVAVFSGTPRDGHGHHQVSGLLAREAYDLAEDVARFPEASHGAAWRVAKFYRSGRFRSGEATLAFDVGGFSPLRGRGYAELAGESRSQHKSQGFGVLQRKGQVLDYLLREASRVNEAVAPKAERDLFDGLDTSWTRVAAALVPGAADSLNAAIARAAATVDLRAPWPVVRDLARRTMPWLTAAATCRADAQVCRDAQRQLAVANGNLQHMTEQAAGVAMEATTTAGVVAVGDSIAMAITLYNRGPDALRVTGWRVPGDTSTLRGAPRDTTVSAGSAMSFTARFVPRAADGLWWRGAPRRGDLWAVPTGTMQQDRDGAWPALVNDAIALGTRVAATVMADGGTVARVESPVVHRFADPVKGDQQRVMLAAPAITVTTDRAVAYARAGTLLDRMVRLTVRSAARDSVVARVSLSLPAGLSAEGSAPVVRLAPGGVAEVAVRVRGRLTVGRHRLVAEVTTDRDTARVGYERVDFDHIRPLHVYRDAVLEWSAVDVVLPKATTVAYLPGVGDNVRPMLEDLGFTVTALDAAQVGTADLKRFSTIVVGPRAFEADEAVFAQRDRLYAWARGGGTLVLQYGQYELTRPGALPYPVTIGRPHDRVTEEDATATVLRPGHPLLTMPNRIGDADWAGWVQERALYMPRTHDPAYTAVLSMQDSGEPPRDGALLIAPLGRGTVVYTTLAFFRQLPAGVPGAARLFTNLLAASPAAAGGRVP
jgi:LmbE family N-acetylglucosaminyl deacetylase